MTFVLLDGNQSDLSVQFKKSKKKIIVFNSDSKPDHLINLKAKAN